MLFAASFFAVKEGSARLARAGKGCFGEGEPT
jgi:hypothetical protein